jgi:hypothetical protein
MNIAHASVLGLGFRPQKSDAQESDPLASREGSRKEAAREPVDPQRSSMVDPLSRKARPLGIRRARADRLWLGSTTTMSCGAATRWRRLAI